MKRRQFIGSSLLGAAAPLLHSEISHSEVKKTGATVIEPSRTIDVIESADIVILGGGPAGCAAAVAAGRLGADVLLIERYGCLGGMATGGLVILLDSYGMRGEILMSGLAVEFLDRLKERNAVRTPEWFRLENPVYCPETLKYISLVMAEQARCRFLFHAWAVNAIVKNDRIDAVIIESKSGRQAIQGKMFIDCTGDGDSAEWAGVPHENTRSPFGLGLDAQITNVDFNSFRAFTKNHKEQWDKLVEKAKEADVTLRPTAGWRNDRAWINTKYPGDALDVGDLTKCEIEMRKHLMRFYEFYRANVPGFENATFLNTASQVGTRESRRIIGDYVMKDADVPGGRFDDSIGTGVAWTGPQAGKPFDFPYRSLVPKKINNLLFAGRCISSDHTAHQNTRVIPNCWVTGQGAGAAAALSLRERCAPSKLAIDRIQTALRKQGVVI